uniref:Uncharacterized protein n=1 Tax=Triparma pacifica TaxID=91992 RepID=A0A7S2QUS9_9STRA|mmetsp:Transcript_1310/g.2318  ORF Transcript_1310/g.2318 Transcript_1310/m.2318 type:complete len:4082 (+) Transcript_1310:32-12277(+)
MVSPPEPPEPTASKLAWKKAVVVGKNKKESNLPSPRSGHSFTVCGANAYLFGGLGEVNSPPAPSNDLFLLRMGSAEMEFTALDLPGTKPPPRWRHTASLIDQNQILLFGGFASSTQRYNDVWVFNTVTMEWWQPVPKSSECVDGNHMASGWPGTPSPRGAHTSTLIGKNVYVFGGYGGMGYGRRDLDDLHMLNIETWKWSKITPKGKGPEKRSGHQATACDSFLYVFGGWNSAKQFDDMFILDTAADPPTWSKVSSKMPAAVWNHAGCGVMAIPSWKIFVFGGVGGELSEINSLGTHSNSIMMLDTGSERWSIPKINGELPAARADTTLTYDSKGSKLIIFGGWANEWYNDVYMLDVGSVVGPPYAIMDIYPKLGPITGNTPIEITGIDFVNTADVVVRFATKKAYVDVKGVYSSQTKITCVSPDCTRFPPGQVEVRVALNNDSFTTTFQPFSLFAVTDAAKSLMYGPGILSGCAVNEETMFIIQARDENNQNRTSGGDEFVVTIVHLGGGEEGEDVNIHGVHVQDQDDGTYVVMYTAPNPGEYEVQVEFKGTFGGSEGAVRGSPVVCLFEEFVSRDNNTMAGKLVLDALKQDLNFLLEFTRKANDGISAKVKDETWTNEQSVNSLVSVKEHLTLIEERQEEINLVMDRSSSILAYLRNQGVNIGPMEVQLKKARNTWETTIKEVPSTQTKIAPLVKQQGTKMRGDIETYEKGVFAYLEEVNGSPFKVFATGADSAIQILNTSKELHNKEKKRCSEMLHLANMFDCPRDMQRSQDIIHSITELLHNFDELWETAQEATNFIDQAKETPWVDINPEGMEEAGRSFVSKVKKLPKTTKESDAFLGLDKHVKEFLKTCPLIGALRHPGMRPRHWNELMEATNVQFDTPSENADLRLREILNLNLHNFGNEVEEITDKAVKEAKQEETLKNLEVTWGDVKFQGSMYKETDVPLIKLSEEDFELLEADQLTLQGMVASRYQFFKGESTKWQKWLVTVSEVNQILSELQRMWSYLEPLFIGSDEVKKELPADAKRFASIDAQVRQILKKCFSIKNVKEACTQSGLLNKLESLQNDQEICKKSLSDFLDGKRRLFPRFYFTSEADLLDILSNGSMPVKIMRHVDKVFLATRALELEEAPGMRPKAKKFIAGVGQEDVDFEPYVPLEGKVEIYLQLVLENQVAALRKKLDKSMKNYPNMGRTDWLMHKFQGRPDDPAQISILVAAIQYVQEVYDCFDKLSKGNASSFEDYNSLQIQQLNDLIKLTQTDLSKADRTRVMVMITMDSHSRDVIQTLIREKVQESGCFQWQSQLKQKYDPTPGDGPNSSTKCQVCDASFDYGFEYLGNGPRLVITPLTDRIYVTATQALNLKMGCAPAGPAGTGKTESTKDLASALGKCCYVFNCSPEMDYQSLGNIFKGLASSGSWGCFDEFNRLIPEVLSVCSVQFKSVCDGNKQYLKDDLSTHSIVVEGDSIKLDPSNGAFITMNPGYLGRSELPEGLKALFRPMTVMVPDLVLICENMLMAEGFVSAKILASKFYTLYSLLKDLLSKQEHYDWGLRAIKSVLVVAGAMKRSSPDLQEDALLMRALRDTNTPKIVQVDEVVFFGLLNDLFPGLDPPRVVDEDLGKNVSLSCEQHGLWADETFRLKCLQLEELLRIRHCVFVMGPAGAGKSACWKMLAGGLTISDPQNKVKVVDLNPKVLPTEDLYGHVSLQTREWKDGLLSVIMRDLGQIPDEKPKWILLDGDLDANWIESMNSVMDDNRMLTLASNERIPLLQHMKLIFEIRDLKHATPATVSRAGILYISTDDGTQWRSLINSWLATKSYSDEIKAALREYFDLYIADTLLWLLINTSSVVPVEDMNRVTNLLNFLDSCLNEKSTETTEILHYWFVYCTVWALGSCLTLANDGTDYKLMFSNYWRETYGKPVKFPSRETVFDYWLDPETNQFDSWTKSPFFESVEFNSSTTAMTSVTVPTPETCSVIFWMNSLVEMRKPIMLSGPAGTGKTQLVNGMLNSFDPLTRVSATINFNFYTTAAVLGLTMGLPLEKKTGSNFGPPGNTKLVYFVDDINLPRVDTYNTQSSIEHLRQHMEYEHMYELGKMTLKNISNTQVVSCLNPTAGSMVVNPRLQRWFAVFAIGLPGPTSLLTIYQTFLDGHFKTSGFEDEIKKQSNNLIKAAMGLHSMVSSTFRKTAANFHYEFNIRHISNVFQGLLVSKPDQFQTAEKFVLLWLHESERVYGDRLVSPEDLAKYNTLAQQQCKKVFPSFPIAKFYADQNADPLVFCHFAENITDQVYDQILEYGDMSHILEGALQEYNETNATMDLVLFKDAMCHIARIVRIVLNEGGHALLVGVGGSGKQSLSRLSAFICGYTVYQIVISGTYGINDLKEDLKVMYNKSGIKEEGIMFLLTDSQIVNERFLVYLNDLLASGIIPDLFAIDEVDAIVNAVTNRVKAAGIVPDRKNCFEFFIGEIRKNLHVCLAFSPVGDDFRNRALKFPAIVNCTVIDWFQPWPENALFDVGKKFLSVLEIDGEGNRAAIEKFLPYSFLAVNKMTHEYKRVERRHVYTTPKSFLELLKLYGVLLDRKRSEAQSGIDRLDNGLQKLKETSDSVQALEEDLKIMLEDAAVKKETAEAKAEVVGKEKAIVDVETAAAQVEAAEVAKIAEEVGIKQRDTEADLAKAEPAVEAAMAALNTLDQKELGSCKGMNTPPKGVGEIFGATMCLLAGIMPTVTVDKKGRVKDRSWGKCKKELMSNVKEYMEYLVKIKDAVDNGTAPHINFKEVREYIAMEDFNVQTIMSKNSAAAGLCSFVLNIVIYYDIVVTVEPKRIALAEANEQLANANKRLAEVMANVAELEEKLSILTTDLAEADATKKEALDAVAKGESKLNLAQRLTNALASENVRWGINVEILREDAKLLTGDVLLASAFISYIGPFTKPFRNKLLVDQFVPFLKKEFSAAAGDGGKIPMSDNADPLKILTTAADVAGWNADGLPADIVSTENGAIVCNSSRWPLMIDPQLQGIAWIRNKESGEDRDLQIVRLGQKDLIRKLERALDRGTVLMIENLGETLEAVLNPVVQRATIKRGSKYFIKVGDKECDFHPNFRLYLHTKLGNPHYPPEIQAECTLINFTVTIAGLEDQLLNKVVGKERPDLAKLNDDLVKQQNGFTIKVKELEDNILFKLAAAEGDITEDVELIEGLEETKRISVDIEEKSALAKETQASILVTSEKYRAAANRSSLLFFMMNDLVKIHTYYIYSLAAFDQVFYRGIDLVKEEIPEPEEGEEAKIPEKNDEELAARVQVLIDSITVTIFNYVRRGLFEVDKLTVATLMSLKILVNDGRMAQGDADMLVMGKVSLDPGNMGPLHEWMSEAIWGKIKALESMSSFKGLGDNMQSDSDDWRVWFDDEKAEKAKMPGDYEKSLSAFEKLVLLRAMRPDRVSTALTTWIGNTMGKVYVEDPVFDMGATYLETNNKTPVFFVLFAGVDPTPWVEDLGKEYGITAESKTFINISMGQGQEPVAEGVVERFAKEGGWVMLQNCHLMSSWVPTLERLLEVVSEDAHENFRCFISAEPPPMASWKNMPESLMQSCIKVANEAPADIKSNLMRAWANFNQDKIDACDKPSEMKACLFSLCWFHSVVCGRRRFGQQGWSRKYSFNTGDLVICSNVLGSYLNANPTTPWDDLRYIFGEIMYGGHITDAWDRRTCNVYLKLYQDPKLLSGLELGPGFKSPNPDALDYEGYIGYVETAMPPESPPLFGLHPNAEIGYLTNLTEGLFFKILSIGGGGGGEGGAGGDIVKDTMNDLMERLPEQFGMVEINLRAKELLQGQAGPYIVVALQECGRMNVLLNEIQTTLTDLDKGLKGQLNMTQAIEDLIAAFRINQWPGRNPFSKCTWQKYAWPSQKNLSSQFIDMLARVDQLVSWSSDLVTPVSIWLPGLFNPSSYLTAVQQVTARATGVALDKMTTETHVTSCWDHNELTEYAVEGTYIHGLFMEGARWPKGEEAGEPFVVSGTTCAGSLTESLLKDLLPTMPVIYVKAVIIQSHWEPSPVGYLRGDPSVFECPVYTTTFRGPTYVFLATLKSDVPTEGWVTGAVALMMQSDD